MVHKHQGFFDKVMKKMEIEYEKREHDELTPNENFHLYMITRSFSVDGAFREFISLAFWFYARVQGNEHGRELIFDVSELMEKIGKRYKEAKDNKTKEESNNERTTTDQEQAGRPGKGNISS